jgi:hypothetical protein
MATYHDLTQLQADGTRFGQSATDLISFYGAVPVARGAGVTTVVTTAPVASSSSSAWCYSSSAQALAIITAVNALITRFNAYGLILQS